jgi:hypothetical protein
MGMFFHSSDAPPERPADPEVRRANLNRIGRLFAAYKLRLGGVLVLIVVAAGLGVSSGLPAREACSRRSGGTIRSLSC